jgi:hypothetical protein
MIKGCDIDNQFGDYFPQPEEMTRQESLESLARRPLSGRAEVKSPSETDAFA